MTTPKPITTPVAQLQSVKPRDGGYAADKTLRDEIAIAAMQAIIACGTSLDIDGEMIGINRARTAYAIADAMLAAREESE